MSGVPTLGGLLWPHGVAVLSIDLCSQPVEDTISASGEDDSGQRNGPEETADRQIGPQNAASGRGRSPPVARGGLHARAAVGLPRFYFEQAGNTIMHIRKAVITAAGANQDRLPLQRFVNVDGAEKTALQIILEEVIAAGIEEVCIVVRGGSQPAYREAAGDYARLLAFVEQPAPRGYGEAGLWAARSSASSRSFTS